MITLNPLEWEEPLLGILRLTQDQRKPSLMNPNLLEEERMILVSTSVSSLESSGGEDSLEQLFESVSQVCSIVMLSRG